ncbi:MAG: tetratricopeptide repeat protein [bacterium]
MELAEARKKLRDDPNDPLALRVAARHYLKEGSYKQAQNCFVQAVETNPHLLPEILLDYERAIVKEAEKVGPRLSLSGFYLQADDTESAVIELEELVEVDPKNVEGYNILGRIYIYQEKIDEAITLLEKAIAFEVKDVRLTETLAGAYLGKGRLKDAVAFYEELLNHKPGDKQTLRILGELYTRLEEYNQAAEKYAAMFSEDPEVVREVIQRLEELLRRVEGNLNIRLILSDIYMKTLNPDAAVAKLNELIKLEQSMLGEAISRLKNILKNYPGHPTASLALAEALARQGNYSEAVENYRLLLKGKPDLIEPVIAGYNAVLEACPEQVLARAYLGEAFLAQNKYQEALTEFHKMIEADPSGADMVIKKCREILKAKPKILLAHVVLGQAYLAKGEFQRAAAHAESVIASDKNFTAAYLLQGEANVHLGVLRKASQAIKTALVIEPHNLGVHEKYRNIKEKELELDIASEKDHFVLTKLYWQKGDKEKAIREAQAAQKNPITAAAAYNFLGNIFRSEGRFDLAAEQYNLGLEKADVLHSKIIRFNLGTTFEAQGEVKKAIKIYETIMQEDLDFGGLKKRIKQLKGTSIISMRDLPLQAVLAAPGSQEIVALWGKEPRPARSVANEEVSVSFGQEHNTSGFEFFMKGMLAAAEEEFRLAVQLDSQFAAALNNLGVALLKEGKIDDGRLRFAAAVQNNPGSSIYQNNLGAALFLAGKVERAQEVLEKSYELDPEASATALNLGDVYYWQKEVSKAISLYRQVGDFDPLSDLARQRLLHKTP